MPKLLVKASPDQAVDKDRAARLWPFDWMPKAKDDFDMGFSQPEWVQKAHNSRTGRVFMMGTGPSLSGQLALLRHLKDEHTWTVNRMARWKELPFTPLHHSIAEPGPVGGWGTFIHSQYDYPSATNRIAIHWYRVKAPGWLWCAKAHDDIQVRWQGFQGLGDYLPPLPTGWASPITSAQLAAWFGYTEFYFLGVDTTQEGQAWDVQRGRTTYKRSILTILECADRMRCEIERAGRKVYDCTPGGRLNEEGVLPYVPLQEVLHRNHDDHCCS